MKIGILGAGHIAGTLANTMNLMAEVELYAVASRSLEKAQGFANQYGVQKAYGSYKEMVEDPAVELVYIATPHSHHYEHMKLCIEHGKHVLCEKSFTMNSRQAEEVRKMAQEKGVLAAEAIWTRYMPSRKMINDLVESGMIGKVSMLTANLCYVIHQKERIMRPELAGGALLDVGVYPLNFAMMHFGDQISKIESSVQYTETGVDGMETITLFYEDGRMASLTAGIYSRSDRKGIIHGDKGYLVVENVNNPQSISVFDTSDQLVKYLEVSQQISGYEYEIQECMDAIKAGKLECDSMPLADTIRVMEVMDELRRQWNLVYPGEVN